MAATPATSPTSSSSLRIAQKSTDDGGAEFFRITERQGREDSRSPPSASRIRRQPGRSASRPTARPCTGSIRAAATPRRWSARTSAQQRPDHRSPRIRAPTSARSLSRSHDRRRPGLVGRLPPHRMAVERCRRSGATSPGSKRATQGGHHRHLAHRRRRQMDGRRSIRSPQPASTWLYDRAAKKLTQLLHWPSRAGRRAARRHVSR